MSPFAAFLAGLAVLPCIFVWVLVAEYLHERFGLNETVVLSVPACIAALVVTWATLDTLASIAAWVAR